MLAVARRRYFAAHRRLPTAAASHYNHATGELVIEPGEALRFNRFEASAARCASHPELF